ncbi:MAG: toll/interleukin-1 receptor domain-containing protein [Candidatus Brocadiia bacterium]
MNHIFISHARADSEIALQFYNDLRNAGHEPRIDLTELRLGDDAISFMNEGIADAKVVIILYSKHTPDATWQKSEIAGALWHEAEQKGARCIVVRLDETELLPLLGKKAYCTLEPDGRNYQEVLEQICRDLMPPKTASSVWVDAFQPGSHNPFRRVRAEFFDDVPNLLAKAFAPPDEWKMSALEEMKPCFLEGPRGTGKSMLLAALRARNLASRKGREAIGSLFGFYLKLSRGAVCNAGVFTAQTADTLPLPMEEMVQIADAFSQEMLLCLLESLFSEIRFCVKEKHLTCDTHSECALAAGVYKRVRGLVAPTQMGFDGLLEELADLHRELANFTRRRFIYREVVPVPVAVLDIDTLKDILRFIKQTLPSLCNCLFAVLLDEYENLLPFQQRVANGLVKLAAPDFTVKVAKKLGADEVSGTTTGQELQEIHDYNRVPLVYDVEVPRQLRQYGDLLKGISERLLANAGRPGCNVEDLLPRASESEVDRGDLLEEVAKLHRLSVGELESLPPDQRNEKITYYSEAAIYRVLYGRRGRQKDKAFSGFDDITFLSSGVIRYFMEILGVAYHLQHVESVPSNVPVRLAPEIQTQAVHIVSQHYLTTLSRNVEVYGERLKYYVLELGDCIRHKLLHHTSEPEAARLTIEDPENLGATRFLEMQKVISIGVREGVFQTREGRPAFKPKHLSDPQPVEMSICRIYAPVLQISPRHRWRTSLTCDELLDLWEARTRAKTKRSLLRKLVKPAGTVTPVKPPQNLDFEDVGR